MKSIVLQSLLSLALALGFSQCSSRHWQGVDQTSWKARPICYSKTRLWNKRNLTWRVESKLTAMPSGITIEALNTEVARCFKSWEPAGVFAFSPARQGQAADITICFDPPPGRFWDGQLGTMGHAAFPWTANRGRIYLDPSEWWSTGAFSALGDRLIEWLPHEIGHALGLQHASSSHDLMCAVGPYPLPDDRSFARLRHLYSPLTPVIATSTHSTAASRKPQLAEIQSSANALNRAQSL